MSQIHSPISTIPDHIRRAILADAIQKGEVVPTGVGQPATAQGFLTEGYQKFMLVADGRVGLTSVPAALNAFLTGVSMVLEAEAAVDPPGKNAFRPQGKGLVPSARALCWGKHHMSGYLQGYPFNVPETVQLTDSVDALQGTVKVLTNRLSRIDLHLFQKEGKLYKVVTGSSAFIMPMYQQDEVKHQWAGELVTYLTSKADKAAQTRKAGEAMQARWEEKEADKVRTTEADKIRKETLSTVVEFLGSKAEGKGEEGEGERRKGERDK